MPNQQPPITDVTGRRQFACSPAAVLAFIVNEQEQVLLLAHPKRARGWEVINGALEAHETVLEGVLREIREEAGSDLRLRPLGTVHVYTFRYDDNAQYMLSIGYLLAYEGGDVRPGSDMAGSAWRWWGVEDLGREQAELLVPSGGRWMLRRATELYRLWRDQRADLQPRAATEGDAKYGLTEHAAE